MPRQPTPTPASKVITTVSYGCEMHARSATLTDRRSDDPCMGGQFPAAPCIPRFSSSTACGCCLFILATSLRRVEGGGGARSHSDPRRKTLDESFFPWYCVTGPCDTCFGVNLLRVVFYSNFGLAVSQRLRVWMNPGHHHE